MEVHLTPAQQAFVRLAVKSGRYSTAEDAVRDALARWEDDERARADTMDALHEGATDIETGRFRDYTDSTLTKLAQELKAEGRGFRATKTPTST